MINQEEYIYNLSHDGIVKGYKWTNNSQNIKGIVVISHGMAEHILRYYDFAKKLCEAGYIVYGHNHRGHKDSILSDNDYGYMSDEDNFNILVNDLNEIIDKIIDDNPNLPVYLFGHSMGSFVSQRYIELHGNKIQGVILCGSSKNPRLKVLMGKFLTGIIMDCKGRRYRSKFVEKMVFGSYNKKFRPQKTEYDWLSRDENEVKKYVEDKYCGGMFTVSYFHDLFNGFNIITSNFDLIPKNLPILIMSGDKDPVGNYGKNVKKLEENLQKISINDVKLKLYSEARHELLHEINKEDIINDVILWLNEQNHN